MREWQRPGGGGREGQGSRQRGEWEGGIERGGKGKEGMGYVHSSSY